MDTERDHLTDGEAQVLGLSSDNFRRFLILEGRVTELALRANPALILDYMEGPLWDEFVEVCQDAYVATRENEMMKWGEL